MKRFHAILQFVLAILLVSATFGASSVSAAPATQNGGTAYDLMVVVDGSNSISPTDFGLEKNFVRRIVRSCIFGADARVGVVQFSSEGTARREIGLSGDAGAVSAAVDAMRQIRRDTDIQEGLQVAQAELAANGRAGAQPIIILVTDGDHNEPGNPETEATNAKAAGTRIFAVGVGDTVDGDELRAIASDPDSDNVFSVSDFRSLEAVLARLVGNACDAPLLPPENESGHGDPPAFVTVAQHPNPNITARPGGIIVNTIVVTNRGEGGAEQVTVTMPFDPAATQVLDATFSQPEAWVSQLLTNTLTFETGRIMEQGGVLTATVRLVVQPEAPLDTSLRERLALAGDGVEEGRDHSNQTMLVVGGQDAYQPHYLLQADVADGATESMHVFSSDLFGPGEPVTFWYHTPAGADVEVGQVTADANGAVMQAIPMTALPAGSTMVAYGNWSGITAVGTGAME